MLYKCKQNYMSIVHKQLTNVNTIHCLRLLIITIANTVAIRRKHLKIDRNNWVKLFILAL